MHIIVPRIKALDEARLEKDEDKIIAIEDEMSQCGTLKSRTSDVVRNLELHLSSKCIRMSELGLYFW